MLNATPGDCDGVGDWDRVLDGVGVAKLLGEMEDDEDWDTGPAERDGDGGGDAEMPAHDEG